MLLELSPVQGRVAGSLAEKQLSTPQQYPLTLNALVLACNQSSNRDPVVSYDEAEVQAALVSLKEVGLVRFVHPSQGRSATRYRQVMEERFDLEPKGLALLAVLLLRGPQTVGELRARTERMAEFADLGDVEAQLARLGSLEAPLVSRLPRQPGQKEERWAQLLAGAPPALGAAAAGAPGASDRLMAPVRPADGGRAAGSPGGPRAEEVAALQAEMEALRVGFAALKADFEALRASLGG